MRVARQHGSGNVPDDAHDHFIAGAGLGEFRYRRVAIIVPTARPPASLRTLVHAVLKDVIGRVGSLGIGEAA